MSSQMFPNIDPGLTPRAVALVKKSFFAPVARFPLCLAHGAVPILLLYLHMSRTVDFGLHELPDVLKVIPGIDIVLVEYLAFGLFLAGWYREENRLDPPWFGPIGTFLSIKTMVFLLAFACIFLALHVLNAGVRVVLLDMFPDQPISPGYGVLPIPLFSSVLGFGIAFIAVFVISTALPRAAEGDPTWFSYLGRILKGRVQFAAAVAMAIFVIDFFFVGFGVNAVMKMMPWEPVRFDLVLLIVARLYFYAVAASALSRIAFPPPEEDSE